MTFETWQEWSWLLRMLIVFLISLLGGGALVLVTSLVGGRKGQPNAERGAEAATAASEPKQETQLDFASRDPWRAPRGDFGG